MKRRLERIILNTEPIGISKHFHSTVETGHIPDHFSIPAVVVFRSVIVRDKLRNMLLDRHRSVGANSRSFSNTPF